MLRITKDVCSRAVGRLPAIMFSKAHIPFTPTDIALMSMTSFAVSSIILFLFRCRFSDVAEGLEDTGCLGTDGLDGAGGALGRRVFDLIDDLDNADLFGIEKIMNILHLIFV